MANAVNTNKQIAVVAALAEGSSIRAIERMTGVHRHTIVRLGVVEVFDPTGHPKANRIYAWAHKTDDPKNPNRYVTVLHIPPVILPQTAVQAVILQEYKSRAKGN